MVFNFFPNGGWNPLRIGSPKALSYHIRQPLGQPSAYATASEVLRQKKKRAKKPTQQVKKSNVFQKFPLKVAMTAGTLSLAGDTIAQFNQRIKERNQMKSAGEVDDQDFLNAVVLKHDFARALRMSTYGFFLYAPGTQCWYQFLDKILVGQSFKNFSLKVLANQLVLGPAILFVVFGWNYLWMGKLKELPKKYKDDMIPSTVNSWKFWFPATCLNFGVVPLHARVAFMSTCGVFWNYYLSSNIKS